MKNMRIGGDYGASGMMGASTGQMTTTMYGGGITPKHRPGIGFDAMTDRSQVSLTFKKFKLDSQREHTREILPNVTPVIKR